MANEFPNSFGFESNERSEGKVPKQQPQWPITPPSGDSASDPIESLDVSGMTETSETFTFDGESSPVVEFVKPTVKMAPTAPKVSEHAAPKQEQTFGYVEYQEEKVEIDTVWLSPHPYHHCMTVCEYVKDCMLHCERTLNMLMCQPDAPMRRRQMALLQDCVEVCLLTTRVIARKSPIMKTALLYCAKVCALCAQECARYRDPVSMDCRNMCLHCSQVCEKFASHYRWN